MRGRIALFTLVGALMLAAVAAAQMRIVGVALAAAGAAMMTIDPEQPVQPTQPGIVPDDTLARETAALLADPETFARLLVDVDPSTAHAACSVNLTCTIYVAGALNGAIVGAGAALGVATSEERTVYAGPFKPFIPYKERSGGLKYGGAALVVGGAVLAALWPNQPAMQNVSVTPTRGGARLSKTFGF